MVSYFKKDLLHLFWQNKKIRIPRCTKAPFPIDVTLFGIVTDVRLLHPPNAPFPIDVTLFGIVTDVRLVQL